MRPVNDILITLTYVSSTVLRRAFSMFDSEKQGRIEKEKVRTILNTMVHNYDDLELDQMLDSEDAIGK